MLTVKLIEPNGHEQIREVETVWTNPAAPKTVYATKAGGGNLAFSDYGTVYVMNDKGHTIARYFLG